MDNIIIATIKEWNIENYFKLKELHKKNYNLYLVTDKNELTKNYIDKIKPKYIFFPHWSWIIPKSIYENYECIVFHETDLPFGQGGSPIQNLISRGIYDTKISALRVNKGIDTGDIYIKESFNLSSGSAQENFIEISNIIFHKLIPKLIENNIIPKQQSGEVTIFKRRMPSQSDILTIQDQTIRGVYDFIRMLDAEGYPKAYLKLGKLKVKFSNVSNKGNNHLIGTFKVVEDE